MYAFQELSTVNELKTSLYRQNPIYMYIYIYIYSLMHVKGAVDTVCTENLELISNY